LNHGALQDPKAQGRLEAKLEGHLAAHPGITKTIGGVVGANAKSR